MGEHDPFLTEEEQAERAAAAQQQRAENASLLVEDAVWLASGPRGRRMLRRIFRAAGVDVMAARITASFAPNHAQQFFNEGTRMRAFELLALLLRALVTGDLALESWQLLWTEKDHG